MTISTLILILLLTFGVACTLDRVARWLSRAPAAFGMRYRFGKSR
jgi:hypothetical protein